MPPLSSRSLFSSLSPTVTGHSKIKMLTLAALTLATVALAQQVGKDTAETHPRLTWKRCTSGGSCSNVNGEIVIDANWRWIHDSNMKNCYDGNAWTSACTGNEDCAKKCQIEGAKYDETYGITTSGNELRLSFINEHQYGTNIGARTYLLNGANKYQTFNLIGNEFTFDVDLSTVACGMNSALYFVPMDADGGQSKHPNDKAGPKYGTGYCDAQCARDLKFVGGVGNFEGWEPSSSDENAGVGKLGSCCGEIDVWESNRHSFAFTPHGCESGHNTYHVCTSGEGKGCGGTYSDDRFAGYCDANGCDYNPYRMGNQDFYGEGKEVDTTQKFTVVTQFESGAMRQFFVQNGRRIDIPAPTHDGLPQSADISPELCDVVFDVFEDYDRYKEVGGWQALSEATALPQVLVLSIWADHYANMLWLDGVWPRDADPAKPGIARGDCPADSGNPDQVVTDNPDAYVAWSNIRFGPIGSTVSV
jgi:cellulose 1,4-beta-cellobiosidase